MAGPANGSLTLYADGSYDYVHDGGETTSDGFTYELSDGAGGTDTFWLGARRSAGEPEYNRYFNGELAEILERMNLD